jgi:AcrR family transcriptional regulator
MAATTRQRYLEAVVDCVLQAGRTDLPLVAMAKAAGTSDRMLVYYFKTREALLAEVAQSIRLRRRRRLAQVMAAIPNSETPAEGIRSVLGWVTADENAADIRLFYDTVVAGFHETEPFAGFAAGAIEDWVAESATAARACGAGDDDAVVFGTLLAAAAQALAADRLTTGDDDRVAACLAPATDALARLLR